MKKIGLVLLGVLLCALTLTGCGRSRAAAVVDKEIKALGRVGIESGDALAEVRRDYDALTEEEQKDVRKLKKLEAAEAAYESYKRINDEIAAMVSLSQASFTDVDFGITYLIGRADEIKAAYRKMSGFEKEQITGMDQIDAAVEKLKEYEENAKTPARVYLEAFDSLFADQGLTVNALYCIKSIRPGGEELHLFALTAADAAGQERSFYSTARCTATVTLQTVASHPDVFFADAPINDASDPIKNGNITLDPAALLQDPEA